MSGVHDHESVDYAGFRIASLWAWTMVGDDDEEGIPAFDVGGGVLMPMIASDRVRIDCLRPTAAALARAHGRPVTLARFEVRSDVEVIEP